MILNNKMENTFNNNKISRHKSTNRQIVRMQRVLKHFNNYGGNRFIRSFTHHLHPSKYPLVHIIFNIFV